MKRVIRLVSFILLFSSATGSILAEQKVVINKQGTVRGRIVDGSKQILPGASIYIDKLHTGVTSDINGFYTLPNLDPGTYTLKVSYVGYDPVLINITIPEGKTLEKDVVMKEGVELQEVVIGGALQGQNRAINAQKSNLGITNIVSADQVGKFPDSNIGDALKRISGINVQYDQGEARFGQVRGTSADLSSVTINGNRVPSAEGDTRNVQLDLIPADMVQTIEVNKVITPDMDADAIGGSINLVTKNSPYKRIISATAGSGWNKVSEKAQTNLGFTYGDKFFNDKLGLIVSASYQYAPSGSDNTEFEWGQTDAGELYLKNYEIRQYYVTRERQSYSAALNWDITSNHKLFFKGIFNNRNDWENRYRTTLKDLNEESVNNTADVRIQTKGGTPDNKNARLEQQRTMDFTLGGEHLLGRVSVDWNVSYAKASEERPNERYIDYVLKKQKFTPDLSDLRKPYYSPQSGYSMTLDNTFSLKEVTEEQEDIQEKDFKLNLNLELPLRKGEFGNKLKFGGKLVAKSKDKDKDYYEYEPLNEDGFDISSFTNIVSQNRDGFMPGDKYKAGSFISKDYLGNLDLNNSSLFKKTQTLEEIAVSFNAKETVTAGYLRFDQNLGKKWKMMAGVRLENTHIKYSGMNYDANKDELTHTAESKKSYLNVLPSLLVKYDANDELKVRASFTNTISRPKYSALIPNVNITKDDEISMGNPDLDATISYNLDLSADYYFKSIGLVSAGVFYKRINDFIVDQRISDYVYNGETYQKFTQPKNAGNADLLGVELGYQRDFGFIAPALKHFGFYGNYTYTYTRVSDFNFEGRENESGLRLPGSPKNTANASLYYERSGLNVRLSYNYASAFIDEMGKTKFEDRYYDAVNYLDLNASYTFAKHYTFYVEANNLLNQPLRYYQGSKDLTAQVEYYGVKMNAGFKINF
ncbi:TonB-dependent receptor [Bacteroides graminisolvens]|uniref:TonB-dependent receptor n=1 Tax=Bacteroides graminisolvens TaxID=477666 RepID=UPI0029C8993D|nr:TonB-dependent receptor [Bacteroides graminisolvens]